MQSAGCAVRTNRLILLGPPDARAKLADLARSLDTPTSRSANTRVIRLRHNDAKYQAVSKVPLLGDIPLLGGLFRSTRDSHIKRNLMVFLRPTVVRDGAGLAALSGKKYSDIRILGDGRNGRPSILPSTPTQLFDGQGAPAVDLRE